MTINMNMVQTIGFAVIWLLVGRWLRSKINFFQKFAIPAPVIGGLIFSVLNLILKSNEIVFFEFDTTLQSFFMIIFFTSIGFNASIKILRESGPLVIRFLIVAGILCVLQNVVAVLLSPVVGMDPVLGLMTGSTPMTGGHGTAAAISRLVEDNGYVGANSIAVASATFGLVMGSLMGGPLANRLIIKNKLMEKRNSGRIEAVNEVDKVEEVNLLNTERISMAFFIILIAMGAGVYISDFLNLGVSKLTDMAQLPAYIGPMIIGIALRYASDKKYNFLPNEEIQVVGEVGLNLFLAMALMTLDLIQLADIVGAMSVLLIAQTLLMFVFAYFVTFKVMGGNYDAAVLSAGHTGFGMGATPNGVANMESVCEKFEYSRTAFFVLPIVGGMFIDFVNLFIIIGFTLII